MATLATPTTLATPEASATPAAAAPVVRTAEGSDADRVISVLSLAFAADPAARWVYPDPDSYWTCWPEFLRGFGGKALDHGTAYVAGDCAGASLWLPPGIYPDEEAVGALLQRSVAERDQADVFAVLEQMGTYHPDEPHWYLAVLGVDLTQQGKGYGSALLQHTLRQCDRDNTPAYLESSNARNLPLYERHGFEVLGTIQEGASPPIWPMLRKPRPVR